MGSDAAVVKRSQPSSWFAQAGLLTAIPIVLLVGPALGYYLGSAVDRRWTHAPWGMGLGILIGLLSSARVTVQLIQQAQDGNRRDD